MDRQFLWPVPPPLSEVLLAPAVAVCDAVLISSLFRPCLKKNTMPQARSPNLVEEEDEDMFSASIFFTITSVSHFLGRHTSRFLLSSFCYSGIGRLGVDEGDNRLQQVARSCLGHAVPLVLLFSFPKALRFVSVRCFLVLSATIHHQPFDLFLFWLHSWFSASDLVKTCSAIATANSPSAESIS